MQRVSRIAGHLATVPTAGASLAGKVAVVTGGSAGIGQGCALALAKAGATVYVTGRSMDEANAKAATDAAASEGKGKVIGVRCDHSDDASTAALFARVLSENGRIDILVNNATNTGGSKNLKGGGGTLKFWQQDAQFYDSLMDVGCRSHFLCSIAASKDMIARKQGGLIVNISSFGAVTPYSSVVYAMGKTAIDRMTADCAIELKEHNVAMVSVYPGLVKTQNVVRMMGERIAKSKNAEWPEFLGRSVVALANDPNVMNKSGKVTIAQELADEYGFTDVEGHVPKDKVMRGLREKYMKAPPPHWTQ